MAARWWGAAVWELARRRSAAAALATAAVVITVRAIRKRKGDKR
jgi:hypothetical protein